MVEFIRVNGDSIDIEDALAWQSIMGKSEFTRDVVSMATVAQRCAKNGVKADPAEMQSFLDEFRYAQELESAEEFNVWLKENGYTLEAIQAVCEIGVLRNKLRAGITDDEISQRFAQNKSDYDIAEVYRITVEDEDLVDEIHSQLENEEATVQELAINHSIEDTSKQGGYLGELRRADVHAEVESAIFNSSAGDVLGPYKGDDLHAVYVVGEVQLAELDGIREVIRDELFDELIGDLRSVAEVEETLRLAGGDGL